jgi:antitoxin HicB
MSDRKISEYPFTMRHLSKEEGGGYLIEFPDLPGCMSDGESIDEAIENGKDAIQTWIETAKEMNRPIPNPGELESQSGKWVQRVPKSIHLRLVNRAREEGVSLNTLVITLLSESLAGVSVAHREMVKCLETGTQFVRRVVKRDPMNKSISLAGIPVAQREAVKPHVAKHRSMGKSTSQKKEKQRERVR